ncbi:hypothetical protein JCM19992_06130 [Thermostilla marina]
MKKRRVLVVGIPMLLVFGSTLLGPGSILANEPGAAAADLGNVKVGLGTLDYVIVAAYLVGIILLGCLAGLRRKRAEGSDYFLASKSLTWPVIGLALFATNISTIHLVSFAENGYTSGLTYGNFEWMAAFTLIILSMFFAPFYLRANVATLPDFLEKRYSRGCRDVLAILSMFSAIAVHIGFSLLTGAVVIEGTVLHAFVDDPEKYRLYTVLAMCGATAIYTIVGGLLAVVWTESLQTIILLAGAACITYIGLDRLGGWSALQEAVHPVNLSILRSQTDPTGITWYAVFLGYPVLGIWYWCTDQTIVQRVLGAKDEHHARMGPLFAGFLKILPVFLFVLPGVICLALVNSGKMPELPAGPDGNPITKQTYTHMITTLLGPGFRGVVIAALLAALMSTVSGALNSIATLFSYDIYRRWTGEENDRKLVRIGRIATFVAMCIAIAWTMALSRQDTTLYQALVDVFPVVAPPTAVVFVWGVFWKRTSSKAALAVLIGGPVLGIIVYVLTVYKILTLNSLFMAFVLFVIESFGIVILSVLMPQQLSEEAEKLVWKSPWEPLKPTEGAHYLLDYRVFAALLLVVMVGLYVAFTDLTPYYPVAAKLTLEGKPVTGAAVTLETDDPRYRDTLITDLEGKVVFGTEFRAGGVPAGTKVRLRLEPARDYLAVLEKPPATNGNGEGKAKPVWKIALAVPAGAEMTVEDAADGEAETDQKSGGKKIRVTLTSGDVSKSIVLDAETEYRLIHATDVPAVYRTDDSPLVIEVEPDVEKVYALELAASDEPGKPATTEPSASEETSSGEG